MPSFNTTIEDTSPLFIYSSSSDWYSASSHDDNAIDLFSDSSYTATTVNGASMSFEFFGSSVAVYGSRRSNHGTYVASVDNSTLMSLNGTASPDQFGQILFATNLDKRLHSLTIVNADDKLLDVDFVTFKTSVGLEEEDLIVNIYKDTDPAFNYIPSSAWIIPNMVGTFMGGSGHATGEPNTVASFTFQVSDAVALYGPVGPNFTTSYSASIDTGAPMLFSANKTFYHSQQVLFFAGNLAAGKHSLQIQPNIDVHGIGEFAIDYAVVYSSLSLGGSFLCAGDTVIQESRLPPVVIAGLCIAWAIALFSSIMLVLSIWRRRAHTPSISQPQDSPSRLGHEIAIPYTKRPIDILQTIHSSAHFDPEMGGSTSQIVAMPSRSRSRRFSIASPRTAPPRYFD